MASVPKLHGGADRLSAIPGNVPRIGNFPPGCRFAPRCQIAKPECSEKIPELVEVEPGCVSCDARFGNKSNVYHPSAFLTRHGLFTPQQRI